MLMVLAADDVVVLLVEVLATTEVASSSQIVGEELRLDMARLVSFVDLLQRRRSIHGAYF